MGQPEKHYALYQRVKSLIETAPDLLTCNLLDPIVQRWLGQGHAAVAAVFGDTMAISFKISADHLGGVIRPQNAAVVMGELHRALSHLESKLPPGMENAFIRPGDLWGAFVQISDIFARATSDILVVDPYLDDSVLRDYAVQMPDGMPLRLLTAKRYGPALTAAVQKWNATYPEKAAQVRVAAPRVIHDRIIAIDRSAVWIITQSLKDLGATAPATVTRFVDDLTPDKLAAYEDIWAAAEVTVPSV